MFSNRDLNIRNLSFNSEELGTFFSKSYIIYTWKFNLDGVQRIITLAHSRIKGKRVITLDKKEICNFMKYTYRFSYEFSIDSHTITINQNDEGYILKIDGINFQKLINQQKLERYNIIREEYIKEHPIIVKKKTEEKKEEIKEEAIDNDENFEEVKEEEDEEFEEKEEKEDKEEEKEIDEEKEIKNENKVNTDLLQLDKDDNIIKGNSQSERTIIDNTNHFDLLGPEIFNSAKMSERNRNNDINSNLNIEMMINNNYNKNIKEDSTTISGNSKVNEKNVKNTESSEENEDTNRIENPIANVEQNLNIDI